MTINDVILAWIMGWLIWACWLACKENRRD